MGLMLSNDFDVKFLKFNAVDLWDVKVDDPFPASKMNLGLSPKGEGIPGFGIYSVAYNSPEFGDCIIYLGKYSGTKSKNFGDNALAGDVRERWFKHIGSATLLLRNLKMSSEKHYYFQKFRALEFYKNDPEFMLAFDNSFLNICDSTLHDNVFIKGADLQVSKNRLGFAIQNLKETHPHVSHGVEGLQDVLSRFTLYYWKVNSIVDVKKSDINTKLTGGKKNVGVESTIIKKYGDRLPMNNEYVSNLANESLCTYYHYDPKKLIKTKSQDFFDFSNFIHEQIKNIILR